jgi:hypothetical protein
LQTIMPSPTSPIKQEEAWVLSWEPWIALNR